MPQSYRCGIMLNTAYRFIFIRNRKAASTTIQSALNALCKSGANPAACCDILDSPEQLTRASSPSHPSPAHAWANFLVFTTSRNPWSRAASGYEYVLSRWTARQGPCTGPSFATFCAAPFVLGTTSNLFHCSSRRSTLRGDDVWNYDFYHVEPAAACMVGRQLEGGGGHAL